MVKQILTLSTLLIYLGTCAQTDDPASATTFVPEFYSLGTTINGNISGASASGLTSFCGYTPTDDVFLQFAATTQGLKIEGTTEADFIQASLPSISSGIYVAIIENGLNTTRQKIFIK